MQITLTAEKTITVIPAQTKTVSTLTVVRIVDLPTEKRVRCFIQELNEPVDLWEGADYDTIGQWTDTDVTNKLLSLYS
jgi:hypothetical protein